MGDVDPIKTSSPPPHTHRATCLFLMDVGRSADAMLDDVNQLMSTGHLPGLFLAEEVENIIKTVKPMARLAGLQWSETDRTGALRRKQVQGLGWVHVFWHRY